MSAGRDALLAGSAKLLVSGVVLAAGFRAVSDDDYARLVIAQRFAQAPSLDPSGTSWLPLPFWTYGSALALFGNGLGVARAVAVGLGVVSVLLVLVAARWLGASRAGALLSALVAGVFPWSAWLGAATLPEAPTAGLIVLAMASLSQADGRRRVAGAVAIALASFCRYEAWPVAAVFCALTLLDARRTLSRGLFGAALVALLPMLLWLLHGAVRHGDALFFVTRVASYKRALGGSEPWERRLLDPLVSLVFQQPLLVLAAACAVIARHRRAPDERSLRPYARGFFCSLALIAFLCAGELTGGAPTHHSARALLPVWYFLAAVLGHAVGPWLEAHPRSWWITSGVLFLGQLVLAVLPATRPPDFAERGSELDIGAQARTAGAPRLLIDTPDFGYFAVTAAFGQPLASEPLSDRDPRKSRPSDPFRSHDALSARLDSAPGSWLVATREHRESALAVGRVRAENTRFVLVQRDR